MFRLLNPTRPYAWGSTTHIARLCGLPASDQPCAEMWFGAHPADPSRTEDGRRLDDVVAADPAGVLGEATAATFGGRLPFLMKLLAAAEPLSLQVHPSSERARIRFAEQNAAGIDLSAPERSYQDASHKPELIFALTRFEGMAGFRDLQQTEAILRRFRLPWLDDVAQRLSETRTPFQTLRDVVTAWLSRSGDALAADLAELREAAARAAAESHGPRARQRPPEVPAADVERESIRVLDQTQELVDRYPRDPGVLVTLLLNHVVLAAGDAMFLEAGVIHAYTSGFGVEVMAASDNVLRAGLTPKHVDIPELLEVTSFTPVPPPHWEGTKLRGVQGVALSPPVDEFELLVLEVADDAPVTDDVRPMLVLCLDGEVTVANDAASEPLRAGQSVFVPWSDGPTRFEGHGRLAIARTPKP